MGFRGPLRTTVRQSLLDSWNAVNPIRTAAVAESRYFGG
jgi:hypothetical protein